jgi:hypothetical protein
MTQNGQQLPLPLEKKYASGMKKKCLLEPISVVTGQAFQHPLSS